MRSIESPKRVKRIYLFRQTEIDRFPIECHKTKTKVITLANRNRCKNTTSHSEFKANTCDWRQARENESGESTIGFGLDSHWLRKWCNFCQPITERRNAKPNQTRKYFRYSIENRTITH